MTMLEKSLQLVMPGDWMATYDLTSASLHIPIHPDYHKYLGFGIEKAEGATEYNTYICMSFGLETATQCLGQVTSCLLYTSPSPRDRQKSRMPSSA